MKKGKGKYITHYRSGIKKEITKELDGYYVEDNHIENVRKELALDNITEHHFLGLVRFLKTYEERKNELEKRNYKKVNKGWEKELPINEMNDFYYETMTITNSGEVEIWIKRKSFGEIKQLLIKTGMVFGGNPYEKYMVLGDDMKTEHLFYRKK